MKNKYAYTNIHIYMTIINERRSHKFKREKEQACEQVWTEKKKGRNGVIIL